VVWRRHQLHWWFTSVYKLEKTSLTINKIIRLTLKFYVQENWMHHASFNFEMNSLIFVLSINFASNCQKKII